MEDYLKILEKNKLFNKINLEDIGGLSQCLDFKLEKYKKGEYIFIGGDLIDKIYLILEGEIEVTREDYYGNKNIIGRFKSPNIFAEAIALSREESPVSAYSLKDSKLLAIDSYRILESCESQCSFHRQLVFNLMKILANKNLFLNEKIDHLSKASIEEKLMAFLYSQARKNKTKSFTIDYNRQELADYLSVNRSALSREMARLKSLGIIDYNRNKFKIN